jgi:predicted ester cyclase
VSGNQVITRCVWRGTHKADFMGLPATGRSIAINIIHIDRWVDGLVTEHYGQFDSLGLMQQLGAIPDANAA